MNVDSLFQWAREISQDHPFWDFHTHPFCVMSGDSKYQAYENHPGIYSKSSNPYHPPKFEQWSADTPKKINFSSSALSERALLLSSRMTYTFTGPRIFSDLIDQIGITNVMLLPLVRDTADSNEMVEDMANLFSEDSRFKFGCPLPVELPPEKFEDFFQAAISKWDIKCIKIHPNLSGIDPLSDDGQKIYNSVLRAAGDLGLPIVIHGGRTPGITPVENQEFGTIKRLAEIDWGASSSPIIIAHAGCYGLSEEDVDSTISTMENLLGKHANLMVDTSAISHPVLKKAMTRLDSNRFIFGSDALYFSLWSGWLSFLKVLNSVSDNPEEDLIRIASINPINCLP